MNVGANPRVQWAQGAEEGEPDWGVEEQWDEKVLDMMVQGVWESKWSEEMRWWDTPLAEIQKVLYEWGGAHVFGGGGVGAVKAWDAKKERERVGAHGEVSMRVEVKFRVKLGRIERVLALGGARPLQRSPAEGPQRV